MLIIIDNIFPKDSDIAILHENLRKKCYRIIKIIQKFYMYLFTYIKKLNVE